ncbi:MAG: alkaline phosphatase family protein [Planctomycetes bacterium]|nr:alkaline phosphatase family protein [Planctomycetota bacterium]
MDGLPDASAFREGQSPPPVGAAAGPLPAGGSSAAAPAHERADAVATPTPHLLRFARDLARREFAALVSAFAVGSAYLLPAALTMNFTRPFPEQAALGLLLGAWLAVPAAAWALLRCAVHAAVFLAAPALERANTQLRPVGAHLAESLLFHAAMLLLALVSIDGYLVPMFHAVERGLHPFQWILADAALAIVSLAVVAFAGRPLRRLPDRVAARGALLVLLAVLGGNLAAGAVRTALRPQAPRGAGPAAAERVETGLRVLLLGLDGASWNILDDMLADGELPHFQRVLARGARGDLASEAPFESPTCWSTIQTGRPSSEHGIISYLALDCAGCRFAPRQGLDSRWLFPFQGIAASLHMLGLVQLHPVTAEHRRADTLWELVEAGGGKANVVNCWTSYPAAEPRGCIVSDAFFREWIWVRFPLRATHALVEPESLRAEVEALTVPPAKYPVEGLAEYGDFSAADWVELRLSLQEAAPTPLRLAHLKWDTAVEENIHRVGLELFKSRPADLNLIVSGLEDEVNHYFAPHRWPERFDELDADEVRRWGRILNGHHRRLDRRLRPCFEAADERTVLLVVSDHGFQMLRHNPLLPEAHGPTGVLVAAGGPVRKGALGVQASIYDVTPTVLYLLGFPVPRGLSGRVVTELFEESFVKAHPPRRQAGGEPGQ